MIISKSQFLIIILVYTNPNFCIAKRGPHHPRSELSQTKSKVDQHLTYKEHHIEDDLEKWGLETKFEDMNEDDKNFYYFKLHDFDGNDRLDGLEMLHAALHQCEKQSHIDGDYENETDLYPHIIEAIDDLIRIADVNKDGYLHYPEYMTALSEGKLLENNIFYDNKIIISNSNLN